MIITKKRAEYGFSKCRKCNQVKPIPAFRQWIIKSVVHASTKCMFCERGAESTETHILRPPVWRKKGSSHQKKRDIIEYAKSVPCVDCRRRFPTVCMDFDHRPGHVKVFNISGAGDRNVDSLAAEMMKCDVVCANCHRIRTANRGYAGTGRPPKKTATTANDDWE